MQITNDKYQNRHNTSYHSLIAYASAKTQLCRAVMHGLSILYVCITANITLAILCHFYESDYFERISRYGAALINRASQLCRNFVVIRKMLRKCVTCITVAGCNSVMHLSAAIAEQLDACLLKSFRLHSQRLGALWWALKKLSRCFYNICTQEKTFFQHAP